MSFHEHLQDASSPQSDRTTWELRFERHDTRFTFAWRVNRLSPFLQVRSVDLLVTPASTRGNAGAVPVLLRSDQLKEGPEWRTASTSVYMLLANALKAGAGSKPIAMKLLLPAVGGYVAQSNIFEVRFHGCPHVELASDFLKPRERIDAFEFLPKGNGGPSQLSSMLASAVGAFTISPSKYVSLWEQMDAIEGELPNRLSLQLFLPDPVLRKRVGLVLCRDNPMSYELLLHLGIELVIFETPGHFMESDTGPSAHLRSSFHALDLTPDEELITRLYDATKELSLDGLTSRLEAILPDLARVSEMLGICSSSVESLVVATDKHLSRKHIQFHGDGMDYFLAVKNPADLQRRLQDICDPLRIDYPVVVKPTHGGGSFGVVKATNESELVRAVDRASQVIIGPGGEATVQYMSGTSRAVYSEVLIEPYVDGPEVDLNIVMLDGEVLFSDLSDNAPTPGDLNRLGESGTLDFQENLFMYPSRLPDSEQVRVLDYMRKCILDMGLRTGVFHCEARVRDSAMHYARQCGKQLVDLEEKNLDHDPDREPSVFLIEINCRPPGYFGLYATTWAYGVDLWGLHVLLAVNDISRFRALSVPFANGAQHDSAVILIMPEKGGILKSADPAVRMREEKPQLAACISLYQNFFRPGEYVTSPDELMASFASIVVVETTAGRHELMRIVEEVRKDWVPVIE